MSPLRLLVVDDETALLQLLAKYLTRLGYAVDACASAGDAWDRFHRAPGNYALVAADLTLPDMPGEELLRRMLELNPRVCVLVCSGYPYDPSDLPVAAPAQAGFLQKPFSPKMLAEALERLLAKPETTGSGPEA
ncbi:MAG: response regulator [Bryobacteraceae bacterium]